MLDVHDDEVVAVVGARCTMANSMSVIRLHSGGLSMQLKGCAMWPQLGKNDFSYFI